MNEYIGRYEITGDIHFRPAIRIGNVSASYYNQFGGAVKIWIGDWPQRKNISPTAILEEMGEVLK